MKVKVQKKEIGGLLKPGDHNITITECALELSKEQPNWSDKTPQLKVVGKNKEGQITAWMNLRGYKNSSDFENGVAPKGHEFRSFNETSEKFLVNKATNKRVADEGRTAKLLENVGNLAFAAGIESESIDTDDLPEALVGQECAVRVRETAAGKIEAYYFMQSASAAIPA